MEPKYFPTSGNASPKCIGSGLIALDLVIDQNGESDEKYYAGGSCGNVLTILSLLGWDSHPVAKLGSDPAGKYLVKDMVSWGVNCTQISFDKSTNTPVIIEILSNGKRGIPSHSWKWFCPNCGTRLPIYKPIPADRVEEISEGIKSPTVYYFDKVARSNVELAKISKSRGAIVVFEPSRIRNYRIFRECLEIADIVKYSHDSRGHLRKAMEGINVLLEIETFGEKGLHYRINNNVEDKEWKILPAYSVGSNLKDTAGSGDWCSAGIIHNLCNLGRQHLINIHHNKVKLGIEFGQALAALSCYFVGARGLMYGVPPETFETLIKGIWTGKDIIDIMDQGNSKLDLDPPQYICPRCLTTGINLK